MYKDIFESIRNEAEKRNLRERTIQLYCSDVRYFLRWIGKNVSDLTLEDAESFLTAKRLEGRSPETHNHYRSAIKFLYKKVLKTVWDDDTVPAMKRERNLPAVLSRDEINAIIDATPNLKHKAIIATMYSSGLRVSEVVHLHYCDSVGFTQIPGFLPENPLKNAEMAVEDDYGMIDGIINNGAKEPTVAELEQQARSGQSISLIDLAAAAHREEREKKKSVMEQLKSQPKAEHKKTAPKKSAEREI